LVSSAQKADIVAEIEAAAGDYEARFPLRFGIPRGEVRSRLGGTLRPEAVDAAVEELVAGGRLFARDDRLRLDGPFPGLPPRLREVADRFKQALEAAGYSVPTVKEGLAAAGAGPWPQAQELLVYLAAEGEIVRLGDDLAYTREQLARLEAKVTEVLLAKGVLGVADFKEATGVSRKYAVPLLEYLDGRGISRRSGDNRVPGRALAGKAQARPG
jgi:selenocysteine-specific elongation factor